MSRSKKKQPFVANCCDAAGAMKKWKQMVNSKIRRLSYDDEAKVYKKISDIWDSPSDGKRFCKDAKAYRK